MSGLELARPAALYGAALLPVLVALHLYRRRRQVVVVPFLPLLREASAPVRSFGGFSRLAEAARLALRVGALAALVLAAAGLRPVSAAEETPPDLVVVLDADVTQRAIEGDPAAAPVRERFDGSLALAAAHVRAAAGERVAVVVAGATPSTLVAPTPDRDAAVRALADLEPTPGAADLAAAIVVARALRSGTRPARIVVVTARALPVGATDVEAATSGRATDDSGFVDVTSSPGAEGRAPRVRLVARTSGDAPVQARVLARWADGDGASVVERDVTLVPGTALDVVLDVEPPDGGGVLVASLVPVGVRDAFPENDVAAVAVAPVARPSVLVVHAGSPRPFVRALLDAMGGAIDREGSGFVRAEDEAAATRRDLTIYDGTGPTGVGREGATGDGLRATGEARGATERDPTGAHLSPLGPAIYLAPTPAGTRAPFRLGRTLVEPLVWRAASDHPLLRGVEFATAYVAKATTVSGDGLTGLAFVDGEAVLAEGGAPGARFVVLGLDPDGSDLPVRAALPILLRNAIRRLVVVPASPLPPTVRAGRPIEASAAIGGPWRVEAVDVGAHALSERAWRRARPGAAIGSPAPLPRPSLADRPLVLGTWRADAGGPGDATSVAVGPLAPPGGPYVVTLRDPASGRASPGTRTASVDLDPARTIRPARSETPLPAPLPVRGEPSESRILRGLLLAAAGALVVDALLGAAVGGARRRRNVAPPALGA